MAKQIYKQQEVGGVSNEASQCYFDNTGSNIESDNVEAALKELDGKATSIFHIKQAEYDALSEEEKSKNDYIITDAPDGVTVAEVNTKVEGVKGEIVGINDDISRLKGYPYLQNTTIKDYLDNNFPQNSLESINIRFLAVSSDNVGDLPTSSAYHISATRNHGASPWCLEATEVITNGFKKFIGYKGYGNDIVWQELARKNDIFQYTIPVKFDANSMDVGFNYKNLNMQVPDGCKVISTVVDYSSWNDALMGTCSTDGAFITYAKYSPTIDIYANIKVTVMSI